MLEQLVRHSGRARQDPRIRRGFDFDRDQIERAYGVERECARGHAADALTRSAERFQNRQPRSAESALGEKPRQRCRIVTAGRQNENARARSQMRPNEIE